MFGYRRGINKAPGEKPHLKPCYSLRQHKANYLAKSKNNTVSSNETSFSMQREIPCNDSDLSWRKPGFDPIPVSVGLMVDRLAMGQIFLRVLRFSLPSTIPLMSHIQISLAYHRRYITRVAS